MARTGKIARLPLAIREELNHRLRENESGQTLLEWLNADARVQKVCKEQFGGEAINDQNLSNWRSGGFVEWMKDQDDVEHIRKLQEVSLRMVQASGGKLSKGLLALHVGRIQEALETFWEGMRDLESVADPKDANARDQTVTRLLSALSTIRGLEIEEEKMDLKRAELDQKGEALKLAKDKFARDSAKLFIKWMADEKAREIAEGRGTEDAKVAQLIQLWFGDQPESIGPEVATQ